MKEKPRIALLVPRYGLVDRVLKLGGAAIVSFPDKEIEIFI